MCLATWGEITILLPGNKHLGLTVSRGNSEHMCLFLQQAVKSLFLSKHLVPMHVFSSVMFARAVKDLRLLRNPPDRQNSVMILSLGLLQPKPATAAAGPASLNSGTRR